MRVDRRERLAIPTMVGLDWMDWWMDWWMMDGLDVPRRMYCMRASPVSYFVDSVPGQGCLLVDHQLAGRTTRTTQTLHCEEEKVSDGCGNWAVLP